MPMPSAAFFLCPLCFITLDSMISFSYGYRYDVIVTMTYRKSKYLLVGMYFLTTPIMDNPIYFDFQKINSSYLNGWLRFGPKPFSQVNFLKIMISASA